MTGGVSPTGGAPLVAKSAPRVRLVVQAGSKTETTIDCRRVVTLIGSRLGCKVTLRHRRVSPVHVAIVNTGSEVLAVDLVTSRGTLLNGLKMEYERLSDGDLLTVAPWEFRVDIEEPAQPEHHDVHPIDLEPTPRLIALEHLKTGRILSPERDVCVIGRRSGCDVTIADTRVSRTHALLMTYMGHLAIFDLLSENPTLVNDRPASFKMLKDGEILTIGDSQFRVRLVGSKVGISRSKDVGSTTDKKDRSIESPGEDMIDIEATERSKQWRIAESAKKASRRRQ